MRNTGSMVLISAGWGVASFLGAALLWPAYQEMALVGSVIGLSTGLAFLRARLIDEWKYIPILAAIWAVGAELPVIVIGPRPGLVAEVFSLGIAGTATGLLLRISGRDVQWQSLMFAGTVCAIAPIAKFVVGIPVFATIVLLAKDPPTVLINALFGVGGCVAGALAGLVLLTQLSRSDSAERVSVGPVNLTNKHLTPQGAVVYEAFISYRHSKADERWANWLHSQLESWRTPVVLSRSRGTRKRLLPVFMDQAELIASPDLPSEIRHALEASRFLIVVCSPRTPHSRWISEEVDHFIRLGRRKDILFLLIEGELRDALPLSYAAPEVPSEDAVTTLVEPLAADVRPIGTKTSRKKRRLAILKLVAPILGVGLDDLRRRDEQRRRRNGILTAVAACAAIATVGVLVSSRIASDRLAEAKGLAQKAADVVENKPIRGLIMAAHALKKNLVAGREADPAIVHTVVKAMSQNSGTPLNGHNSAVRALAFARDEAWLVSADFEGRLGFWNLKSSPPRVIWKETGRPRILTLDSSEDGRWFVAGADGLVTMCDVSVSERVECSPIARPEGQIWSAAFSPDDTWLATGGTDKQVRLWRKTGNGTFEYFGELPVALSVVKLSWSPMGEWLAASTAFTDLPKERQNYNCIVLWQFSQQGPGKRIETPASPANLAVQFSPDGTLLVAGDVEGSLRFWRVAALQASVKPDATLRAGSSIMSLAFHKSSKWFVTGDGDGTVRIWELEKGPLDAKPTVANNYVAGRMETVYSVAVSATEFVAVGSSFPVSWAGQYLYDRKQISRIGGHEQPVTAVVFSPTGGLLASADFTGAVRLHDVHSGFDGSSQWASDVKGVMSGDGRWVATTHEPPRLYGSVDGFRRAAILPDFHSRVSKLAFSPESDLLVALGADGSSRAWFLGRSGVESSQELASIGEKRYSESSRLIVFDCSGKLFATAGDDGTGYVWRRTQNSIVQVGQVSHLMVRMFDRSVFPRSGPLADQIYSMSFSRDGKWLATGSANGSLLVWDLTSGSAGNSTLPLADGDRLHPQGVSRVQFMKFMNDHLLVSGGGDGRLVVRSWIDGKAKVLITHEAFKGFLTSLSSDVRDQWLAAGGGYIPQPFGSGRLEYDSRVLVWKAGLLMGDPIILLGLQGTVRGLAFHPTRELLAGSGGEDIRFWDLSADALEALPIILKSPGESDLVFSDDGRYLFASGPRGSKLWSLDPSDLLTRAKELAGRNLTPKEWSEEFGERRYEKVFADLP